MLQFFSASTSIVNSKRAITECLENALEGQPNLDCDLIIIYSAMGHNFKDLLSEARRLSPGTRIAGCTGGGVIGKSGPDESMTALAIMAIKGPINEFTLINRETKMGIDPYLVGSEMARELKSKNPDVNTILFLPSFFEWMPVDKAIEGIKSVFGSGIPILGGVACDNIKGISCFHFYDNQVVERGAVMVGFADKTLKIVGQSTHGFNVIEGMSMEITRTGGSRIFELNGKPAWKVLTETLGVPETVSWVETLAIAGFARELPEELNDDYGSKYILFGCLGRNEDDSIITAVTCNNGMKIRLTRRDEKKMFEGVDSMVMKALDKLSGNKPLAVFHTDCSLRGRFSLNRILKDELINRIQCPICRGEDIPWLGWYSGGEFGMIGGQSWIHNFSSSLSIVYR